MARDRNTDVDGQPFDVVVVDQVWDRARTLPGYDAAEWRRDVCGRSLRRSAYGVTASQHGWEIDHIKPVANGGTDDLGNLQPLQWQTNRDKGDTYPWKCPEP